ncbi:hypothetical protein BDV25DRAFT_145237 [Aspergillus avenaceus]|uniref:Tyrosine phosphatase family-domain-containing protein n=1 Tax=Aspergillus avenaceus TaxID=36643 RepID=A0A5N6TFD8_ASPAV|nr:hypothetical protein BDV25DRAFT_145237 [Aspergillus avenaceus]
MAQAYNLPEILATDIRNEIPSQIVHSIISQPPFIVIPGLFNIRDISNDSTYLRCGYAYRSGVLSSISDQGKSALHDLNITTVFDLRRLDERTKSPAPVIDGVEIIWEPYTRDPGKIDFRDFEQGDQAASGFEGV